MTTARILHFPSGFRRYGLALDQVGEIAVIDRIEPVPGAAAIVAGVAELRGRIVTLLALDGPASLSAPPDGSALAVLLAGAYGHLGILVAGGSEDVETGWRSSVLASAADEAENEAGESGVPGVPLLLEDGATVHLIDPEALAQRCTDLVRRRFRVLDRV